MAVEHESKTELNTQNNYHQYGLHMHNNGRVQMLEHIEERNRFELASVPSK